MLTGCCDSELPVQHIASNDTVLTLVLRQPTPARPCSQRLRSHESLNAMQTALIAQLQHIEPDTSGAIGAVTDNEALAHMDAISSSSRQRWLGGLDSQA